MYEYEFILHWIILAFLVFTDTTLPLWYRYRAYSHRLFAGAIWNGFVTDPIRVLPRYRCGFQVVPRFPYGPWRSSLSLRSFQRSSLSLRPPAVALRAVMHVANIVAQKLAHSGRGCRPFILSQTFCSKVFTQKWPGNTDWPLKFPFGQISLSLGQTSLRSGLAFAQSKLTSVGISEVSRKFTQNYFLAV